MIITPTNLQSGILLGTSGASVFTAPATDIGGNALISAQVQIASFTNNDSSVHKLTVNLVRSGASAGNANLIIPAQPIAPGQTWNAPQLQMRNFAPGDVILAFADTAGMINVIIDGFMVS